jgi:hypothetical protein
MRKFILILAIFNICAYMVTVIACGKKSSDPCSGVTCNNGGTCSSGKCNCPSGFAGPTCDSCTTPCTGGCVNGTCYCGGCQCKNGYTGTHCDSTWVSVFLGTAVAQSDTCGTGANKNNFKFTSTIAQVDPTHFSVNNMFGQSITAVFRMVTKTTFYMDSASGSAGGINYLVYGRGIGTYTKNKNGTKTLRVPFYVKLSGSVSATDTCTLNLTR